MDSRRDIKGLDVSFDGTYYERVVIKPFAGLEQRVPYIKLDSVYIYFPEDGEIIISKEDINSF